jgi:hypothetical protein
MIRGTIRKRYRLRTRLSVDECIRRLECSTQPIPFLPPMSFGTEGNRPFYCRISGRKFLLHTCSPKTCRGPMSACFWGAFGKKHEWTVIEGTAGLSWLGIAFISLLWTVMACAGVALAWAAADPTSEVHPAFAVVWLLAVVGAPVLWVALMNTMAGQKEEVVAFLERTLCAECV